MSFKIFSLQLLGKIKPVEKIEQQRETLYKDYLEFQEVEKSDELAEFVKLEQLVNSSEFKNRKAEIQSLKFEGSKEYNELKEFEKLKKAKNIKNYIKAESSTELKRFGDLKDSDKLKEYYSLEEYVKEGEFQKEKKEIKGQVFKGSVEETHLRDFEKLKKSKAIKAYFELNGSAQLKDHESFAKSETLKKFLELKNQPGKDKQTLAEFKSLQKNSEIKSYFKFEHSQKLKLYKETADSHDLKKYEELKAFTEKDDFKNQVAFLKDKKKFEKSETFKKWQQYKQLAGSSDVKFVLKYEKSSIHKNYLDVKESFDLKRFKELSEIVSSKEFLEKKAYLEDKKKWEKTEEFEKEQKYLELKKSPRLVKYFSYKGTPAFAFFTDWDVSFEDDFSDTTLNSEKWSPVGYIAEKLLGGNYSLAGDLNIFTDGKNIRTGGRLVVESRKEKTDGKIWNPAAGFIPVELDYSSGQVSTGNSFWQEDGIFEAKIKFDPVKQVASSFFLQGEKNSPRINLLEMGIKNRIGISSLDGKNKIDSTGIEISNLKKNKWYIFTLMKEGNTFTWKINDLEVLQLNDSNVNFPLHLNASNLVVDEIPGSKLPVQFEIDWVKCYTRRVN